MIASVPNRYLAGCTLLIALTGMVYYPGLSSGFFLDDGNNLAGLDTIPEFGYLNYIFGGTGGPAGRPLSLLSFALQYGAWPEHPFSFKIANLFLHLLCGGLVFLICARVTNSLQLRPDERALICFFISASWLLHPIQVTTVLYTVQRMTQLSSLFVLAGILLYLHFRQSYIAGGRPLHLRAMVAGVWGCTLLAVLCKENGILLPLYILVIDKTLLSHQAEPPGLKITGRFLVGVPLAALLAYLVLQFHHVPGSYGFRPYSMTERLLTEPQVLLEYVKSLLLPFPGAFSLYHDDYPISRGLLEPPATLISLIVVIALIVTALVIRNRHQAFAFGILWFFAGHALESTYLNLELYFEHRNYLPSLGILALVAALLIKASRRLPRRMPVYLAAAAFAVWLAVNTTIQAGLWAKPLEWHIQTVERHPRSARALIGLGNLYLARGRRLEAEALYHEIQEEFPGELYPYVKLLALKACIEGRGNDPAEWRALIDKAGKLNVAVFGVSEELIAIAAAVDAGDCPGIDVDNLIRLVVTLAFNPRFRRDRAVLHEIAARLGIGAGDPGVAYHNILEAVRLSPAIPRQMLKLRILRALGREEEAEQAMTALDGAINGNLRWKLAYGERLAGLKEK